MPKEPLPALDSTMPIAVGKVSQRFKSTCSSVVEFKDENNETVVLIPKDPLGDLDVEGLQIEFNYRLLRMANPEGCTTGRMAEIRNARIKK